jgi:mono/diheme cytochrome c family protein
VKPPIRLLRILAFVLVLAAASFAFIHFLQARSASARARRMKNPVPATPAVLAAAQPSYADHCQKCHGEKGDGQGEKAVELSVAPSDFTNTRDMANLADGELFQEITKGHLPMPAFEDKLSDKERWQLVDYIRTFASSAKAP